MLSNLANAIQASIRQNYNLTIKSATPIGTGAMSTTMRLGTNRGTLFLKIYKSARNQKPPAQPDLQRIAFTHIVQNFLYQEGFPVPRLLRNNSGETFSVCDQYPQTEEVYALSEFIEGSDYDVRIRISYLHRGKCSDIYTSNFFSASPKCNLPNLP